MLEYLCFSIGRCRRLGLSTGNVSLLASVYGRSLLLGCRTEREGVLAFMGAANEKFWLPRLQGWARLIGVYQTTNCPLCSELSVQKVEQQSSCSLLLIFSFDVVVGTEAVVVVQGACRDAIGPQCKPRTRPLT